MGLQEYVRDAMGRAMEAYAGLKMRIDDLSKDVDELKKRPRSITDEIDQIEGRRLDFRLIGKSEFVATDQGRFGTDIKLQISQDGPFIWTHGIICMWKPTEPENATLFGVWRPVWTWPLPMQAASAGVIDLNLDFVSLSYEIKDSGSQRDFQNDPRPPDFSIPGNLVPLSVPTLFTPNSTVTFRPYFERILFNNGDVPPTKGELVVEFPGYRIVNM